jgi:hypothetical protein
LLSVRGDLAASQVVRRYARARYRHFIPHHGLSGFGLAATIHLACTTPGLGEGWIENDVRAADANDRTRISVWAGSSNRRSGSTTKALCVRPKRRPRRAGQRGSLGQVRSLEGPRSSAGRVHQRMLTDTLTGGMASAPIPDSAAPLPRIVDVAIVGSGYTGMSAARDAAQEWMIGCAAGGRTCRRRCELAQWRNVRRPVEAISRRVDSAIRCANGGTTVL